MSVRRVGVGDLFAMAGVLTGVARSADADPWDFLADPYSLLLVAEEGGHVVGWLCGYELIRLDGRRMLLISSIEVAERARHRGHGRALVDAALGVASRRGHTEVLAVSEPHDRDAHALFTGAGAREGRLTQLYRWAVDRLVP
jgi:ribosomal protein S18 acetylase RimI-like enzyme